LTVFLDKLVRRAISLIDRPSRTRILRTFAYIAMVCISYPYKTSCLVGKVATPWSSFGEQNRVSLVSFQRAATPRPAVRPTNPIPSFPEEKKSLHGDGSGLGQLDKLER